MVDSGAMTLAVVDDDVDVRVALKRLLRAMGHQVRLFASAEEFAGDGHGFDCVILDIRLPGLNGLELREQMRAAGRLLPLVFITGDGDHFLGDDLPKTFQRSASRSTKTACLPPSPRSSARSFTSDCGSPTLRATRPASHRGQQRLREAARSRWPRRAPELRPVWSCSSSIVPRI